jgi:hypothetical protein
MKIEWATIDKDGHRKPWLSERAARIYIAQRVELGAAKAGQEKVVKRKVSTWEDA